jgi:hypothetical protein
VWTTEGGIVDRKSHTAEEIVNKLRQAEAELIKGQSATPVCKLILIGDAHTSDLPDRLQR